MVNQINSVHICFVSVQTGVVIVDDCEMAVAVKFGTQEGSFGCAAAAKLPQGKGFQRYGYELCVFVFEHHWILLLGCGSFFGSTCTVSITRDGGLDFKFKVSVSVKFKFE